MKPGQCILSLESASVSWEYITLVIQNEASWKCPLAISLYMTG